MKFQIGLISLFAFAAIVAAADSESDNDENQTPANEAPIVRTHFLAPGEREYLSPNLIGLQNIAITNLPLTIRFVNVIDAFREVVNGVRYEIIVNAVNSTILKNKDIYNETETETDTAKKDKNNEVVQDDDNELICRLVIIEKPWLTTEWGDKVRLLEYSNCTDAELPDPNSLNVNYKSNAIFDGGARTEMSEDDVSRLESQIIIPGLGGMGMKRQKTDIVQLTESSSVVVAHATPTPAPSDSDKPTTQLPLPVTAAEENKSDKDALTETTTEESSTTDKVEELSDDAKKWLDDFFTVTAVHSAKELKLEKELKSEDESNSVHPDGVVINGGTHADEQNQPRLKRSNNILVGGPKNVDNYDDAEEILKKSLKALANGDGPTYTISKIHSATVQVVAGSLHKIDADLVLADGTTERCKISVWSRPWIKPNGIETTLNCADKEEKKFRHARSVDDEKKNKHKKSIHGLMDKPEHLFMKFENKYGRSYASSMERQMRLRIFKNNLNLIQQLNRMEQGTAKYGVTEFADMTSAEYKMRTGLLPKSESNVIKNPMASIPNIPLPREFDWRQKGVITEVKNQGQCGSCWAFSVTGNIEGLHAIKTGKLEEYSEQELIDCDTIDQACNGGLPDNAYQAIEQLGGLELETEYPYEGKKDQCHFNNSMTHVRVKGAIDLPKNETEMAQWLIANGPISIGINANAMQFYRGGISHPWRPLCRHSNLDHGVLIVGYGISEYPNFNKTLPYWIVKNSWGPKWGEQGYYRVYRGDNTCGINSMASSAVLFD